MVSRCVCCVVPECETIHHTFVESQHVVYLWRKFGDPLGVNGQLNTIISLTARWWGVGQKTEVHNYLLQITLIVIVWELLKSWCACKYGTQKKFLYSSMEHTIYWNIKASLGITFPNCELAWPWIKLCDDIEKLKPVTWNFPEQGNVKMNTDGSYMEGKSKAGIGGILKNAAGDLNVAFSIHVHYSSNNMREALADKPGIQLCLRQSFTNFDLQLDYMLIVDIFKKQENIQYYAEEDN